MSKHKVEVEFTGTEFDNYFFLEGRKVTLHPVNGKYIKSDSFEIVGDLDIMLISEGFQGTKCTLSITVDEKIKKVFPGTVSEKGVVSIIETIEL